MTFSIAVLIAGLILAFFAMPLSRRYNAWTTRVREKQNRAPTEEMRVKNTRIFAWLLRIAGVSFIFLGVVRLLVRMP